MARIDDLKRKLSAREGKSEFKENVAELKKEIARLEQAKPVDPATE